MSHQDKTPVPPHTRLTEEERAANWKQYQLRVRSFAVPEVDDVQVSTDTAPPPLAYVPPFLAVEGTWELELEEDKKSGVLRRSLEDRRSLRKFINDAVTATPTSPTRVFVSRRKRKRPRPGYARVPFKDKNKNKDGKDSNAANTPGGATKLDSTTPSPLHLHRALLPPLQHFATHYRRGFIMGTTPRGENPQLVHTVKWEIEYSPTALTCDVKETDVPILTGVCVLYNEPDGLLLVRWHANSLNCSPSTPHNSGSGSGSGSGKKHPRPLNNNIIQDDDGSADSAGHHQPRMDYLALGKDAVRLVASKRRGRAADPVFVSVQLRLASLLKIEYLKATRLQRWYRNIIDMRIWLPRLQKKAQERKEKRASTRIQTAVRKKLAEKHINGPHGRREQYTTAANKMQRAGREFVLRTREREARLAREKKELEIKEKAEQKRLKKQRLKKKKEAAAARNKAKKNGKNRSSDADEGAVGGEGEEDDDDDFLMQGAANQGNGDFAMPGDNDDDDDDEAAAAAAAAMRKTVTFADEDKDSATRNVSNMSPNARKFRQELKSSPHLLTQRASKSIFHRFSPEKKSRKVMEAEAAAHQMKVERERYGSDSSEDSDGTEKHPHRKRYSLMPVPKNLNTKLPSERVKYTSRRGSTLVPLLAHAQVEGDGDSEEDSNKGGEMDALMADAMVAAGGGDESLPSDIAQDDGPALQAPPTLHRKSVIGHQFSTIMRPKNLGRMPTEAEMLIGRRSLPTSLTGFECECLMDFFLPKSVARKVASTRSVIPREIADTQPLPATTMRHVRTTCHARIFVGRGLARYDVLVPPFGLFSFLLSGCDPDDVTGATASVTEAAPDSSSKNKNNQQEGLKYDQIRYIWFVRSMEMEDSDNPDIHRTYLTAGDVLGREGGSSSSSGTGSPRSATPDLVLGKTAKRIHSIAEYVGMAVTRLSLATMGNALSDQQDDATTPREPLLRDIGVAPLAGVYRGAKRVSVANRMTHHHVKHTSPMRGGPARAKHARRVSVFIDIDGDGVMDDKIIGSHGALEVNTGMHRVEKESSGESSEKQENDDRVEEKNQHHSQKEQTAGAHYDVFAKTEKEVERALHHKKDVIDRNVLHHGSTLEIDWTTNLDTTESHDRALVLAISRAGIVHLATSMFAATSMKTCAWHPPRKARCFVDIIVPLKVPPKEEELDRRISAGGDLDLDNLSLAYSQPRLGIEWIVQVFTGIEWQYGKATRYGGDGLLYVEQLGSESMGTLFLIFFWRYGWK